MKRRFIYAVISLGIMSFIFLGNKIPSGKLKIWQESSFADFTDGEFQTTVLEDKDGGQIRLPHPMQKTQQDSLIPPRPRFVEYDASGNYYAAWVDDALLNVYLRKYSASGQLMGDSVQINDISGKALPWGCSIAVMKSANKICVVWADRRNSTQWVGQPYAQIFNLEFSRIGSNIQVSDKNAYASPRVTANFVEGLFWLFYSHHTPDPQKLFLQKVDPQGMLSGSAIPIISLNNFTLKNPEAVACQSNGSCLLVTDNGAQTSDSLDLYLTHLGITGDPSGATIKINDDNVFRDQYQADIAVDPSGNFLIIWVDWRDEDYELPYNPNICGQYFDSTGTPIGENFLVNHITANWGQDWMPEVKWEQDHFNVIWLCWSDSQNDYLWYQNKWYYRPVIAGSYLSSVFDMGPSLGDPQTISWQSIENRDTAWICFQLRSAANFNSIFSSPWLGPSDSNFFYTKSAGEIINPLHKNQRFLQYQAIFNSQIVGVTPILQDVSITYSSRDTMAPNSPKNLAAQVGHSRVRLSWDANQESDLMAYQIYRSNESGRYSSSYLFRVPKPNLSFLDTSATVGKTYYYVITALDSNLNESSISNEARATPFGIRIFVDDDAAAAGDGSPAFPFKNITDGINQAIYGDTVWVQSGIYIENLIMKSGIVLKGTGAKAATIQGLKQTQAKAIIIGAEEAVIEGFTIVYPGFSDWRPAIFCEKCSMNIVNNILLSYGSSNSNGMAILCNRSNSCVSGNFISSFGVGVSGQENSNVIFQNNIITNRTPGYNTGIDVWDGHSIIRNNTIYFYDCDGHGIYINSHSWMANPEISNNIIVGNQAYFSGITNISGAPQIAYNDVWVAGEPYSNCEPGIGAIQFDPIFINSDRGDFRLAEGSPCIDAGNPDPMYKDLDGSRNDLGAFGGPNPIKLSLTLKLFLSIGTSSISGFPGDPVKVGVAVDNAAGIARGQFVVEYDSKLLTPIIVQRTDLTHDFLLQSDMSQISKVKIALSSEKEIKSGTGSIVDIVFIVNPNAQSEQACPLRLSSVSLWDGSNLKIELKEITHGLFVVNYMSSSEHIVYVDGKNNGFENGSQQSPFNTIQEGIDHASDGDTVVVVSGVYQEILEIDKGIFLKGAGARATTIEPNSNTDDHVIHISSNELCGISGFTITYQPDINVSSLINVEGSNAIIAKNRLIGDDLDPPFSLINWFNGTGGVIESNYCQGGLILLDFINCIEISVQNNTFMTSPFGAAAINSDNSNIKIQSNQFIVQSSAAAIFMTAFSEALILNNLITSQEYGGSGIMLKESSGQIKNNTIVTEEYGISSIGNSLPKILNNILVGSKKGSWGIHSLGAIELSYNDVWNHTQNYRGVSPGVGDISANPLFVDSLQSDFRLNSGSPCIDAGHPDPAYNDRDGSRNDMGAFGGPFADTTGFLGRQIAVAFVEPQQQSADTLCIPVIATSVQGISNIEMKVEYNESHLRLLAVRHGEITQPFSLSESQESPGITQLRLSSPLVIRQSSGSICELIAQVQTTTDTSTVIRLNDLIFKDQVDNIYAAAPVERRIAITAISAGNKGTAIVPDQFALFQNYPNPFNPSTVIRYNLPKPSNISLKIYNLLGQEIRSLYEGIQAAGNHQMIWDGKDDHNNDSSSGIYFIMLQTGELKKVRKVVLVR